MSYVVNNLHLLYNKAVGPEKNPKSINVGPMSIPEARVMLYLFVLETPKPFLFLPSHFLVPHEQRGRQFAGDCSTNC